MATSPLSLAELRAAVRAADKTAFLVPPRLVRRVIKRHRELFQLGLRVPHRKTYVIDKEDLLKLVEPMELGVETSADVPETVILIAQPDPEKLAALPRELALTQCWRQLFHARIDQALCKKQFTDGQIRQRIQRIGQVEFDEIRLVLRQEKYLLPPRTDASVYIEFAAVYLELRAFAPKLLRPYFPGVNKYDELDLLLKEDVDAAAELAAARPVGAPPLASSSVDGDGSDPQPFPTALTGSPPDERLERQLDERAQQVAGRGNLVRATLLQARAGRAAGQQRGEVHQETARSSLQNLVTRLLVALELPDHDAPAWRAALLPLLEPASRGIWPVEARALYDLQKVCIDHEKAIHAVDLIEWIRTLGQRPLKRPLPGQREWLIVKHLRSAYHRVGAARVLKKEREVLEKLLESVISQAEHRLRDCFRPRVAKALDEVGLNASNYPEKVARLKLIEEVLDRVVASGYLTIGDLRDAVSRNNLKLKDLGGPIEFLVGDKLLKLDHAFIQQLDGIYRRGEIYLRWLQRLTALAFGNLVGRFLMLFVLLPFGGSWATLETIQHVLHPVAHYFEWPEPHIADNWNIILLGVFLLLLLNVGPFRRLLLHGLWWLFRAAKSLIYDLPMFVLGHPWLRAIWEHPAVQFVVRLLIKPALLTVPVTLGLLIARQTWSATAIWSSIAFIIINWLLNSRLGQNLEEIVLDWLLHNWERVTVDLLPGLVRFVWDLFKRGLESIDRLLYSVDEWLRFRSGEGWTSFILKLILGFFWFFITYLVRIYINVLIEPHFNPIKHFPAVTVGAKILLPFTIELTTLFAEPLRPLVGDWAANSIGFIHVWMLPGVFGFLVWEMLGNWRLYEANRAKTLRPVMIGSHGESLVRLLRPGFHSGTIPKLYLRLRRAERRGLRFAVWRSARKYVDDLHHVQESLEHFVKREFVELLAGSRLWGGRPLTVGAIHLGTHSIRIDLHGQEGAPPARLLLAEQSGWLLAGIEQPGWLVDLNKEEKAALALALTGLYLLAGIDLTREQLDAALPKPTPPYDLCDAGLAVWPDPQLDNEIVYDLRVGGIVAPRGPHSTLPALDADRLSFSKVRVTWEEWVAAWEADQAGKVLAVVEEQRVLP